jgi:hypothetical protein
LQSTLAVGGPRFTYEIARIVAGPFTPKVAGSRQAAKGIVDPKE